MSLPPGEWSPLAVDASARRYFKGRRRGAEVLLADFGEDADGFARFVSVARLLSDGGIRVPEILEADEGRRWIVQEFVSGWPLSKGRWPEALRTDLLRIVSRISALQGWPEGPERLEMDEARLRFELDFFRLHFLEGCLNAVPPRGAADALGALAAEVATFPTALAHRDFHSENLLQQADGTVVVIDFQDALLAPRAYDAASLAVDPYRSQDPRIASGLKVQWLAATGMPALEFDRTALQRALKALGTFGYQVTRKKRARYMRFIAPQARRALDLLDAAPLSLEALRPELEQAAEMLR